MKLLLSITMTLALLLVSTLAIAQDVVTPPSVAPAQVIASIASLPFAAAVVALLRKAWPAIDGVKAVGALVLVFALAGNLLGMYAAQIPPIAWVIIATVVGTITTVGSVQLAQNIASKGGTAKTIEVIDVSAPQQIIPPAPRVSTITERG